MKSFQIPSIGENPTWYSHQNPENPKESQRIPENPKESSKIQKNPMKSFQISSIEENPT